MLAASDHTRAIRKANIISLLHALRMNAGHMGWCAVACDNVITNCERPDWAPAGRCQNRLGNLKCFAGPDCVRQIGVSGLHRVRAGGQIRRLVELGYLAALAETHVFSDAPTYAQEWVVTTSGEAPEAERERLKHRRD